jgi:hypothetical protein
MDLQTPRTVLNSLLHTFFQDPGLHAVSVFYALNQNLFFVDHVCVIHH